MKKKIITLCLVIAMLSVAVIGGTLAYFTDVDRATNEFTVGNVDIDLYETVGHKDSAENSKDSKIEVNGETGKPLTEIGKGNDDAFTVTYGPAMPGDELTKVVTVENPGKEAAYVALAIKQTNYGPNWSDTYDENGLREWFRTNDWNVRIDEYYEGSINEAIIKEFRQEGYGHNPYSDEEMQDLTDRIFTGSGWNKLAYGKYSDENTALAAESDVRYYPTAINPLAQNGNWNHAKYESNEAALIAVDYAVADNSANGTNMMPATVYDKLPLNHRIWVYYLYLPAGASYTLDLTIKVPVEIDEYSIGAFDGLVLDVRASAIQASGFETAKVAFESLEKVYPYTYETIKQDAPETTIPAEEENP